MECGGCGRGIINRLAKSRSELAPGWTALETNLTSDKCFIACYNTALLEREAILETHV